MTFASHISCFSAALILDIPFRLGIVLRDIVWFLCKLVLLLSRLDALELLRARGGRGREQLPTLSNHSRDLGQVSDKSPLPMSKDVTFTSRYAVRSARSEGCQNRM